MTLSHASKGTPLGRMLRLYRANTEQSVRDLGPEIGISIATLSRIERGGECDLDTFLKLCMWMRGKQ